MSSLATTALTGFTSLPLYAADWGFTPQARIAADYVDNPRLAPRGSPDFISTTGDATAEVSADFAYHGDRLDVTIDPRALYTGYLRNSILNQNNQYLDLGLTYRYELINWTANSKLTRDTTLTSELGLTGFSDANRRHQSLLVSGGPNAQLTERWSVAALGSWQTNHYVDSANTGLVDYRYAAVNLSTSYLLTETIQATIDTSAGQQDISTLNSRTSNVSLSLALTDRLSELWTLTASGGPSVVRSDRGTTNGSIYALGVQREGQLASLSARISRDVTPSGIGSLTKRDQLRFALSRPLSERLTTNISAGLVRSRALLSGSGAQFSGQQVVYAFAGSDTSYQLARNWNVGLSLHYDRQDVDAFASHARSYRAGLSLAWTGRPLILR